jgi:hypothetical protein
MEDYFCKKPCKHCPYRKDVRPFLTAERGEELAYHAQNPYNSFPCHKTTEYDDELDDTIATENSKECAGFLTLMAVENGEEVLPEGFKPTYDIVYGDVWDMLDAYENQ